MMPAILLQLLGWFLAPARVLAVVLCTLLVFSALGVAYSSHLTRNMYRDLQHLEKAHDNLDHEYEKLLLERGAWSDYARLDQLARERLAMATPEPEDMVLIQ